MPVSETYTKHYVNDQPRFRCTFTDVGSTTPTDPGGVQFDAIAPDGTVTTYVYATDAELVKSSTGVYYVDLLLDQVGQWQIWYMATGANAVSDRHFVDVVSRP